MQNKKHYADIIFIIVLIGVFALSSIMLAVLGVNIYKDTATNDSKQELNTAALYFAQKVRQCDDKTAIRIDTLDDTVPALVIESDADGQALETWLFVYEGNLKELTSIKGSSLSAEFGQRIMPLKKADFIMAKDNLLQVTLASKTDSATINLHMADFEGGA